MLGSVWMLVFEQGIGNWNRVSEFCGLVVFGIEEWNCQPNSMVLNHN
jgi:hypothetical protein